MARLSRRDFLKLMAWSSVNAAVAAAYPRAKFVDPQRPGKPHILIFVLDAMSARHLSLYGYERHTTPNLTKFASRANVYHSHFSAANASSPGTATLLTGLYPWRHRAINLGGLVSRDRVDHNIFHFIGNDYLKIAYTQNLWADVLLRQYRMDLDIHIPPASFSYKPMRPMLSPYFSSDQVVAYYAYDEFLSFNYRLFNPLPGSLLMGSIGIINEQSTKQLKEPSEEYPFGVPSNEFFFYFHNEEVFAGVTEVILDLLNSPRPLLGYFHLFAPHGAYCPRKEFVGIFPEIEVTNKPLHPLRIMELSSETLYEYRKHYDEYVANVDAELGKMMDIFEKAGILDSSYIVITSDHGQVFERGEFAHGTFLLYDPVIRVPLLISSPGQRKRFDVFSPTSSTDLVPTLLAIAGKAVNSANLDGQMLPGFGGQEDFQRSIYAMEAKDNSAFKPLTKATISLMRGGKKLIYYTGYPQYPETFELYDLADDIEETRDLFSEDIVTASRLKEELLDTLAAVNRPFFEQ